MNIIITSFLLPISPNFSTSDMEEIEHGVT
jgi:hypothetical protein